MMLIPKTDKWVLVRWHGGVRSVERAKYLLKYLPPGEDLKISTVIKIGDRKDGKPDKATVLISGNERHQLELLSEPGERDAYSDEESPEPKQDKNNEDNKKDDDDEDDDSEEDFEDSSSDWTPESPDLEESSEESDNSDNDKDTSKKNQSPSKLSSKNEKKKGKSEYLSPMYRRRNEIITETVEKLTRLYLKTDREMVHFEKKRREAEEKEKNAKKHYSSKKSKNEGDKNMEKIACIEKRRRETKEKKESGKKQYDSYKQNKNEGDKSMDELIIYMNTMFAGLFKVIVRDNPSLDYPAECKKVKVNVLETGDVVITDKKFYKQNKLLNKLNSGYFDKTLTPYETDDTSDNNNKCEFFDKTLTPHESDDEPLSTISKKNNKASIENKKRQTPCKDKKTTEPCKDKKTPELNKKTTQPCKNKTRPELYKDKNKDNKTIKPCKNKKTPELCKDNKTTKPCKDKQPESCKGMKTLQPLDNNRTSTPVETKKLAEANAEDYYSDCDYFSDRSDDPVLISNKYETVETNRNEPESEWIPIGSGTTLIHKDKFSLVNWKSYTKATRTLLLAAFTRRTLATHSLTGKKSPAFSHKPAKMCLDPKIVSDIVIEVADRFHVRDNLVRNIITTKCADECKMRKMQKAKKVLKQANLVVAANNTNVIENNDEERVPTPEKTTKTGEKKNKKSTSPKRVYTKKTGKKNRKKISKSTRKKTQNNITSPEKNTNKNVPPENQENISSIDNDTNNIVSKNEETILTSDDEGNMVIDEEYVSPPENNTLTSIENKNQENILQPKNTRMSIDNNEEHKFSPENTSKENENQENILTPKHNTRYNKTSTSSKTNTSKVKNNSQENIPPVKKGIKGFKTYKNKSKVK